MSTKIIGLGFLLFCSLVELGQSQTRLSQTTFDSTKGYKLFQESHQGQTDTTKNNQPRLSFVPVFAFGFVSSIAGIFAGAEIDHGHQVPEGKPSEIMTKGMAIGWFAGAVAGGFIGYKLAKSDVAREQRKKAVPAANEVSNSVKE